ncbi:zinc finger CCCH domain-containing protein 66-like [Gossypium australe]|uniref:Zinc finger CCCH domain-containing protein 66-like n=1 Tax=Gossypium australe TaxID=47621 RepID=A0A5B6UHF9_9ROSI|nr:zinc finger CCCH domain-containing protein 66-like [Gossypium australe]
MMNDSSHKVDRIPQKFSYLLELSASNDLIGFRNAIEREGRDIDERSLWYGRRMGSRKMGFEERTPLLIASLFGSKDVVNYIIGSGSVDVNRASGSDGATSLHCAVVGGSYNNSTEVVRTLLNASADTNALDANGNRPSDLIAPAYNSSFSSRKTILESLLDGSGNVSEIYGLPAEIEACNSTRRVLKDGVEKKEYPIDVTLPDIKNGMYGTDEFRMYNFKVTPCSRAYSHDWTECPFVHPGENARRRDPKKYQYSCVPCPEFRKGSCKQGDNCEYAHGIFECWLHPAQYRTRLCKDETNCNRRVCFFAHKPEELRPVYASTGSAVPSPRSYSATGSVLGTGSMSTHALGSPSAMIPPTSTPPLTPTGTSSSTTETTWPNQTNIIPTLQLHGSKLKAARCAQNLEVNIEQLGRESHLRRQKQQLMDEIPGLSSPTNWNNPLSTTSAFSASADQTSELNRFRGMKPLDLTSLPQLQGISLDASPHQLQSPTGVQMPQNINEQLHASYPTSLASPPVRASQSFKVDPSRPTATTVSSPRPIAFANWSQSFMEHTTVNHHLGFSSPASSASAMPSKFSNWSLLDGKLDWGVQGDELNKLKKPSLAFQNSDTNFGNPSQSTSPTSNEPDVSWVQSLVKDTSSEQLSFEDEQQQQYQVNTRDSAMFPAWVEQSYMEQEQMMA